jgi:hypothetical protein
MTIKEYIRAELEKLSKDDLIDIIVAFTEHYFIAVLTRRISQANCIQQCVNQVETNLQPVINNMVQELKVNFQKMNNSK